MPLCPRFIKDVSDKRIVTGDFSEWLGEAEIASAAWTVPSGLDAANESFDISTVTNYFSGGTDGQEYTVKVTVTTNDSVARLKSHSFVLAVEANCKC